MVLHGLFVPSESTIYLNSQQDPQSLEETFVTEMTRLVNYLSMATLDDETAYRLAYVWHDLFRNNPGVFRV